jgi:hypothetical protein
MIDQRFCTQIGSAKQHAFICFLLSKRGEKCLRYAAAEHFGVSVSKMSRMIVTVKEACEWIDQLKKET